MNESITFEQFQDKLPKAVAIRRVTRLQPAGGMGDKIFPPTYQDGPYAMEERVIDGVRKPCVLLDSVQSQANRMELALLEAWRTKDKVGKRRIELPVVEVDFAGADLPEVGSITSLEAPHRLADAILRDSLLDKIPFPRSAIGGKWINATAMDATEIFDLCPTGLVFGMWWNPTGGAGNKGGLGTKIQRSIVSELIGVDVSPGTKTSSRLDPLKIETIDWPIFETPDGGWSFDGSLAKQEKGKPKLFGKEGKPSAINHSNIPPTAKPGTGGVTLAYALQTTVISLPAIRRLHFPINNTTSPEVDAAAHAVLAALGLCGAVLSIDQGCDLRSRCLLIPEVGQPATWEWILADGSVQPFTLNGDGACTLLKSAVNAAEKVKLPWRKEPLTLTPCEGLVALVKRSRELAMHATGEA